jgi:hypothetical protein
MSGFNPVTWRFNGNLILPDWIHIKAQRARARVLESSRHHRKGA